MNSIIKELIDIEEIAGEMMLPVNEQKQDLKHRIDEQTQILKQRYEQQAEYEITKYENESQTYINEKLTQIKKQRKADADALKKRFYENKDKWVKEIVDEVIKQYGL